MTAYCQPSDVIAVLAPSGTPAAGSPAAVVSGPTMEDLCQEATDEVNAWLADRYDVPFAEGNVPDLVYRIARDIAVYLTVMAGYGGQDIPPTHPAQLRYNRALGQVRAVANGQMTLALPATDGPTTGTQEDQGGGATAVNPYEGAMFTPDQMGIVPDYRGGWYNSGWPRGINEEDF